MNHRDMNTALLTACGVDTREVTRAVIEIAQGDYPTLTLTKLLRKEGGALVEAVEQLRLVPTPLPPVEG
jgi:hypothetical protein